METNERRVQTRAQLFVIRKDNAQIPVFALRASDDIDAVPGVITDLSTSGVQILSSSRATLEGDNYTLELVSGNSQDAAPDQYIGIQRVWSRADGIHTRNGFVFTATPTEPVAVHVESRVRDSEHGLLRCVMRPA